MALIDILILLVLATLPAYFFKKKFKIEVQGPLCLWRTKKGLKLLDELSRYRRFFVFLSEMGLIFAFGVLGSLYLFFNTPKRTFRDFLWVCAKYLIFVVGASIVAVPVVFTGQATVPFEFLFSLYVGGTGSFIFYGLLLNTYMIIESYIAGYVPIPGIAPLIPGVQIEGSPISIPIHALFGLIVLIVVHELAHGIVARIEKIKVKSMGLLTAGIFPIGAFTEPDENQLKETRPAKRLRVFAVGSMANFITGIVFLILFLSLLGVAQPKFVQDQTSLVPSYVPWDSKYVNYLAVNYVDNGSPAQEAGFTNTTKIYNIDIALSKKEPYAVEAFVTDKGCAAIQRNASGYFGFSYAISSNTNYTLSVWLQKYAIESLYWVAILNFLVGVINYLPFAIFDGARIFEDLVNFFAGQLGMKNKKIGKNAVKALSIFILILLVVNAMPYFVQRF
jgi:membrane-associated protease RseP (regulator of RpoE activity)